MSAAVITDMPEVEYHAHPALSHSGIKTLLRSPAHFKWERNNGREPSDSFDFGQAAHTKVLGTGWPTVVIDADDWRSKAAREARDEARAAGKTPLLRKDADVIDAMAAELERHPLRDVLFGNGQAETSWFRSQGLVNLRARMDWWTTSVDDRAWCVDFKTTVNANPAEFGTTAARYHYHGQAAFYLDMLTAAGHVNPVMVFVNQEKTAPYLVSVTEMDLDDVETGRAENDYAIGLYARCVANDEWPGYPQTIQPARLPRWYQPQGATS